MNGNFKKVNLVPSSYFTLKKLNIFQYVAIAISVVAILVVTFFALGQMSELKNIEKEVEEANQIIARADFQTRDNLKSRYETLQAAGDAGNFNSIPNVYEDMTDFLACIDQHLPETMMIEGIEGEFTASGVYSYTFSFASSERDTIAPFLKNIQEEEILKYVNITAITLEESKSENTPNGDKTPSTDLWKFALVIKTKGGSR